MLKDDVVETCKQIWKKQQPLDWKKSVFIPIRKKKKKKKRQNKRMLKLLHNIIHLTCL